MKVTEIAARLREMADYLETEATQRDYDFPDKTAVPFIADAFNDDNFRNKKKHKDSHIGATIINIHFPWDPADAKSDTTNMPFEICPAGKHKMSGSNILLTKKGKRRCLASGSQLLEWSEKAQKTVKIAEAAKDATALLAQRQDLRLFWAGRRFEQAQKRFEKIVHIAQEICEACKLKANVEGEF